jgi:hypothetical protein
LKNFKGRIKKRKNKNMSIHNYKNYIKSHSPSQNSIIFACHDNDISKVTSLLHESKWSAFELLQCVIDKWASCTIEIYEFLLSRITPTEMKNTFIVVKNVYTLLTLSRNEFYTKPKYMFKEKLIAFIQHGADINQLVGDKTALSYLVQTNEITGIKLCIQLGADPKRGYLLFNSINSMSDCTYKVL